MCKMLGKRLWVFPDGELPQPGGYPAKGHESVIILNPGEQEAVCRLTVYYTDRPPVENIEVRVAPQRVRCVRTNRPEDLQGYQIPQETQYAMRWECSAPVVMQYGRLDASDQPMHFYTTQGYSE